MPSTAHIRTTFTSVVAMTCCLEKIEIYFCFSDLGLAQPRFHLWKPEKILGIYCATHIFSKIFITHPSTTLRNHVGIQGTGRAEITRDVCLYVHYWLQSPTWYNVEKQPQIWHRSCLLGPDRARFHHTSPTSISPKPDLSRLINLTVKDSPLLKLGYQLICFSIGNVIQQIRRKSTEGKKKSIQVWWKSLPVKKIMAPVLSRGGRHRDSTWELNSDIFRSLKR